MFRKSFFSVVSALLLLIILGIITLIAIGFLADPLNTLIGQEKNFSRPATPHVSAIAYLVGDIDTGAVYAELNTHKKLPIASLTKVMTAIVTKNVFPESIKIPITATALAEPGNTTRLQLDSTISASDSIYPLLMESSNDMAKALALHYGELDFIAAMNAEAARRGMRETRFIDASGLGSGNISTVQDLFTLSRAMASDFPELLSITRTAQKVIRAYPYTYELHNSNLFVKDVQFIGGKVGETTAAKETMLSIFSLTSQPASAMSVTSAANIAGTLAALTTKPHTPRIAIIVLGSTDREADTARLLEWSKSVVR